MRRPSFTSSLCSISQKLRAKTHSSASLPLETPSKAATPQPNLETQQPQPAASSFHAHEEGKTKHWYRSRKRNCLNGSVKETGLVFGNQFSWELKKPFGWEAKVFELPKTSLVALTWPSRLPGTGRLRTFTETAGWTWVFAGGSKQQAFFLESLTS